MGDVGVDDDHIVFPHREGGILHPKTTLSVENIKEFGKIMGVQRAVPVVFIFGAGHIQQLCLHRLFPVIRQRIQAIAHSVTSSLSKSCFHPLRLSFFHSIHDLKIIGKLSISFRVSGEDMGIIGTVCAIFAFYNSYLSKFC